MPEVDREWALIAGDCLHNLRAALDYLMCEIVKLDGGTPTRGTHFPLAREQSHTLKTSPPIHRQDLLDELRVVQPYNVAHLLGDPKLQPKDDLLWLMNRLDIIDKHYRPLSVVIVPQTNDLSWVIHPKMAGRSFDLAWEALRDGAAVAWYDFEPPEDYEPRPPLHVAVNEVDEETGKGLRLVTWHLPYALGHLIHWVDEFVVGSTVAGVRLNGFRGFFSAMASAK